MAPQKQTAPFPSKVLIHLDQDRADALACYLDDEEVFSDVVDLLLKAIPAPEEPATDGKYRYYDPNHPNHPYLYARMGYPTLDGKIHTLKEFLKDHKYVAELTDAVFQIVKDETGHNMVAGYNLYHSYVGRHWYENHTVYPLPIVGYYNPFLNKFRPTNEEMITCLLQQGIIPKETR